jgi:uncharacterized membrane protein YoaK (UPF0700 family)
MLIQQGKTRSGEADRHLAWSLAGIAGALNTAGFYAVGLYSANMTGNVSALSDHLGGGDLAIAAFYLALVATFVSGAVVSTLLVNAGRRRGLAGIYAYAVLAEALLLAGLGCADLWMPAVGRGPALVIGLSFLMGLQNAVVTQISNARVRTTHVTGMLTDIGIELAYLLDLARSRRGVGRDGRQDAEQAAEATLNRAKLRLHGQTVVSFLAGGIVGVLAYKAFGAMLLFGAAALLLALAGRNLLAAQRPAPGATSLPPCN